MKVSLSKKKKIIPPPPFYFSDSDEIMAGEMGLWRKFGLLSLLLLSLIISSNKIMGQFIPEDNHLLDCGSRTSTRVEGRTFNSDQHALPTSSLLTGDSIVAHWANSISISRPSPLYQTARVFRHHSWYVFRIARPGRHWVRLYFFPLPHEKFNLTTAVFNVKIDSTLLLHDFTVRDYSKVIFKEYLINTTSHNFTLQFTPRNKSIAFINAIEVVSIPENLIPDSANAISPIGTGLVSGMSSLNFEVSYRFNVGGNPISPKNDTLWRMWATDIGFTKFPQGAHNASIDPNKIKYLGMRHTKSIAPASVYATATVARNLTWVLRVDPNFSYLVRIHLCDIVSHSLDQLYFSVYINDFVAVSDLDLSSLTSGLAVAYFQDFLINASAVTNGYIKVQIGPSLSTNVHSSFPNAIINGLEVMKIVNSGWRLDALSSVNGDFKGSTSSKSHTDNKIVAVVGLAVTLTLMILLAAFLVCWSKRQPDWEKNNSFSSWHSLNPSHLTFSSSSSSSSSQMPNLIGPNMSHKMRRNSFFKPDGLRRFFTLDELQDATRNFHKKTQIGSSKLWIVYLGNLPDGHKLAIKRGRPGSELGFNEFQAQIQNLIKLRHQHLVPLIGYCDERSEMILVYEYMVNGSLRDRIYGSSLTPDLSWEQMLQVSIDAARGLHYLHTSSGEGIVIHGAVNISNILLDDQLVARLSDFGLYIAESTADNGRFDYLAPECFSTQELTEKSDVYAFGIVLLKLLCATLPMDLTLPIEKVGLTKWAMQWDQLRDLLTVQDSKLGDLVCPDSRMKFAEAAVNCLAADAVKRPTMRELIWSLESAMNLQKASTLIALDQPMKESAGDSTSTTTGS